MKASVSPFRSAAVLLATVVLLALAFWAGSAAAAAELVMYTRAGCPFCLRFEREIGPIYGVTKEGRRAPLRRVDLQAGGNRGPELKDRVTAAPTFVLVEDGREVGRITGYANDDMFWGLLGRLIADIDEGRNPMNLPGAESP